MSIQNLHEEFDKFWPEHSEILKICPLMGSFWRKYMLELKKIQRSYVWLHWRLMWNLKKNWLVLSKKTWRIWHIFVHKLKNRDFILERKMAKLNKNNQIDQMQCENFILSWKKINSPINKIFNACCMFYRIIVLKV